MYPEVCNGSSARLCASYVHFLFSPPRAGDDARYRGKTTPNLGRYLDEIVNYLPINPR
ncbi:hypothetical protein K449DRAFT_382608 [Hypoxylon sp. EC38]|nr:hypothetical protein K449DRAFT_382608 [Hypoxylon sp. EC38]